MQLTRIPAVFMLSAAVTMAAPAAAYAQRETEQVNKTAQIRADGELRLKNFSGRVTITGTNRADVSIHAVRSADRSRLDHIKLSVVETGSGVTIEANKKDPDWDERNDNVVQTDFDIEVPSDVSLDVEVFSSPVDVKGVRGRQRIHAFSGGVTIADAWGSLDVETFSGRIEAGLGNGVGGRLDFNSFSGSIDSDVPITYNSGSRRGLNGTIGAGGSNDYRFKTFSGNVRIR
jgi:hypothetical protein